jgi:hypothetical protein
VPFLCRAEGAAQDLLPHQGAAPFMFWSIRHIALIVRDPARTVDLLPGYWARRSSPIRPATKVTRKALRNGIWFVLRQDAGASIEEDLSLARDTLRA